MSTQRIIKISAVLTFMMLGGFAFGEETVSPLVNIALGKSYIMSPGPNYALCRDDGDKVQLTDGIYDEEKGSIWGHKSTIGWVDRLGCRIVIDLGRVKSISGLSFSTAAGASGVKWPDLLLVFTSDNGSAWYKAGDLLALSKAENGEPPADYAKHRFKSTGMKTYGRYVTILAWGDPFLFTDEIEIYSGSDTFLTLPHGDVLIDLGKEHIDRAVKMLFQKHITADFDTLRLRIKSCTLIPGSDMDGLVQELDDLLADPDLVTGLTGKFRFVIPYSDLHARGLAIYADVRHAAGEPPLRIWGGNRWDLLSPVDACSSNVSKAVVDVEMMKNEVRGAVFNITNGERTPKKLKIVYQSHSGTTKNGWMTVQEVAWTRLRRGNDPNGSALPAAPVVDGVPTVSVPGGLTRQVWLTIDSSNLPAGTIEGSIAVFDGAEQVGSVPLRVRVADVSMPEDLTLALGGWEYSDGKSDWGIQACNLTNTVGFLQRYHVNEPWASPGVMSFGSYDEISGAMLTSPDTGVMDAWLDLWPDAKNYNIFVNQTEDLPGTPAAKRRIAEWISFWVGHLRARGIQPEQLTVHLVDETNTLKKDQRIIDYGRAIKAAEPQVRIFTDPIWADLSKASPDMFGVADRICIHRPRSIQFREKQEDFIINLDRTEQKLGFYSCHMRAQIMDPYAYHRLQAWDCFRRGMEFSMFWSFAANGSSSWQAPIAGGWDSTPQFLDEEGCTTAKHMEAIREGLYDYEYLIILRDRAKAAKEAGGNADAVARAEGLVKSGPERVFAADSSDELYWNKSKDRSVADVIRLEMLALIEELGTGDNDKSKKYDKK